MESTETTSLANLEFSVDSECVDSDRFVSLWNIASSTMSGDIVATRMLASKMLGFLCKRRCSFVVVSPTDAKYLDEWFERDNALLYDWTAESEKVDVLAQHAHVPFEVFVEFMKANKFKPEVNHSPRRADRIEWFNESWNVG